MAVDQGIVDSVATGNLKTLGESIAASIAINIQSAVDSQSRGRTLAENALSNGIALANSITARCVNEIFNANAFAQNLADLAAGTSNAQQTVKGAQTTPPETGTGK